MNIWIVSYLMCFALGNISIKSSIKALYIQMFE